jgi:hypothetical protein
VAPAWRAKEGSAVANKKVSATQKKRRERPYIKFYVTAEQKAQIQREVPDKEVGQYCRDRIFHPAGLRDTAVDVGARLLAMAARQMRFALIEDATPTIRSLRDEACELRRLIAQQQEQSRSVPLVEKRENR